MMLARVKPPVHVTVSVRSAWSTWLDGFQKALPIDQLKVKVGPPGPDSGWPLMEGVMVQEKPLALMTEHMEVSLYDPAGTLVKDWVIVEAPLLVNSYFLLSGCVSMISN